MSLNSSIESKIASGESCAGRVHIISETSVKDLLRIAVVDGVKRCLIKPDAGSLDDLPLVFPLLDSNDKAVQLSYALAIDRIKKSLDGDIFSVPLYIETILNICGVKRSLCDSAKEDLKILFSINMEKYQDMTLDVLKSLIPRINNVLTNGRVVVSYVD